MTVVPLSEIDNYIIGKTENIWGLKSANKDALSLKENDELIFVIGMHSLDEPSPKGFPRLKSYDGLNIQVEELWKARIKSAPKKVENSPFGEEYPIVFEFDIIDTFHDFSLHNLKSELIERVRKLFTGRKKLLNLDKNLFEKPFN